MNHNQKIGAIGEEIAADLLKQNGLVIVTRNFRCRYGEIDIVARDQKTLVFVEVKTRKSLRFGRPEEAVDYRKQARLRLMAAIYLKNTHIPQTSYRFDVCAIQLDEQNTLLSAEILKNCF